MNLVERWCQEDGLNEEGYMRLVERWCNDRRKESDLFKDWSDFDIFRYTANGMDTEVFVATLAMINSQEYRDYNERSCRRI